MEIRSTSRIVSAANSTNGTIAKGGSGYLVKVSGYNAAAAVRYLKIYDSLTVTVGTTTPKITIALAASKEFNLDFGDGFYMGTGLCYALTTGSADSDTGALTAADVVGLNIYYQ